MTSKWSTAKGKFMEMQMGYPGIPVTTVPTVSEVRGRDNVQLS